MERAMNKTFNLIIIGVSLLAAAGCTSKKEQLTASTLTIAIEPASVSTLSAGGQIQLTANCRSAKSDNVDIAPTWSVENNLGTFNPATGKITVFTAGSGNGAGNIYASYADVRSAGLSITVGSGAPIETGSIFTIFNDNFSTELAAPGAFTDDYGLGSTIALAANTSDRSEGTKSFSATYSISSVGWSGWYVAVAGSAMKNMSAYTGGHLRFDIKSAYDIQIGIRSNNVDSGLNPAKKYLSDLSITPDGAHFQSVSIPISLLVGGNTTDLTQMKDMFIAAAVGSQTGAQTNKTFLIDNIRWTVD
jgi:hypothetical protein